jgi:putative Mn2+ efflux pump MntP
LQSLGIANKVIAASLALSAFAVAVVAGLAAGNPPRSILFSAVVSMIACQILGLFIGSLAERAIADHLAAHKAANPIPSARRPAPQLTSNEKNSTSG